MLCGMTLPMLCLPTAFIGALGLVPWCPKLAEGVALGGRSWYAARVGPLPAGQSVLILPAMALLAAVGPDLGAALFGGAAAGRYILPLAAGVALSCYQSVLGQRPSTAWAGPRPPPATHPLRRGGAGLVYILMGLPPGLGLRGYVAAFLISTALGLLLNWRGRAAVHGLRPRPLPVAHRPRPVRPAGRAGDQTCSGGCSPARACPPCPGRRSAWCSAPSSTWPPSRPRGWILRKIFG